MLGLVQELLKMRRKRLSFPDIDSANLREILVKMILIHDHTNLDHIGTILPGSMSHMMTVGQEHCEPVSQDLLIGGQLVSPLYQPLIVNQVVDVLDEDVSEHGHAIVHQSLNKSHGLNKSGCKE